MKPGYTHLTPTELTSRASQALDLLAECSLCPRQCRVNRLEGQLGFCQTGRLAKVAAAHLHFGEETPFVGRHGSGTIFLPDAKCFHPNTVAPIVRLRTIRSGPERQLWKCTAREVIWK